MITLLVSPLELEGSEVTIDGDLYHHVFRVRRAKDEDRLRLVDGEGQARWGRIERVDRKSALLRLLESAESFEPDRRLRVFASLPRGQRASWLVEKCTELGAVEMCFFLCRRGGRRLLAPGLQRLQRVAIAAVEQSHRSVLPRISADHSWDETLSMLCRPEEKFFFLDLAADAGPEVLLDETRVSLLIGPEGGWSDAERDSLQAAGGVAVKLPLPTLRVETAAVAASAIFLAGERAQDDALEGL